MAKRWGRKSSEFLAPDEIVRGAAIITPPGRTGRVMTGGALGAIGGAGGAAIGFAAAAGTAPEAKKVPGRLADSFTVPDQSLLLLTNMRWLHLELGGLVTKPKGVLAEWALNDVRSVSTTPGRMATRLHFTFSDGSVRLVEVPNAARPKRFVSAVQSR